MTGAERQASLTPSGVFRAPAIRVTEHRDWPVLPEGLTL